MRETELISRIRARSRSRNRAVRVGIGDDCAVLQVPPGEQMVITTDFSLEGRHFRRDWHTPESVGHRCLARGLSDVAAMGGRPVAAFLSLALPSSFKPEWVDGFFGGFGALANRFAVELAGGDTSEAPGGEIAADIVVVGAVPAGKALLRSGAQVGDGIYVTGHLGAAAAELARVVAGRRNGRGRHLFPEPRVAVGRALLRRGIASSCIDLSDGLSTDLGHLCAASGVGAEIAAETLPLAERAALHQGLHGGEDYELLFTAGGKVPRSIAGVELSRLGSIIPRPGVWLGGERLLPAGWEHFQAAPHAEGQVLHE